MFSMFQCCVSTLKQPIKLTDPSHVLEQQSISIHEDLSFEEQPIKILDRKKKLLRNKTIPLVKVL